MKQIPSLSFRKLQEKDLTTTKDLADVCQQSGYFRLVEVEFENNKPELLLLEINNFFKLSGPEKKKLLRTEKNPWGYFDKELTKNMQDWKEIFDLKFDRSDPNDEYKTPWPLMLPNFFETTNRWHQLCENISLVILNSIERSLGLNVDSLARFFTPFNSSFLRLNYYPACETPADPKQSFPLKGNLGIHHHTDAGAITILLQDEVSGLQFRHKDTWQTISSEKNSLVINVGDLIQVWSNDLYKAPLHRVLANKNQERFSAAFFMNPSSSTNCSPQTKEKAIYRSVNWAKFRSARAAGDYENLGREIQISDYKI